MSARIIDGSAAAAALSSRIAAETAALIARHGVTPGLAVVLVGDDPASAIYVRSKIKRTAEAGMRSIDRRLPAGVAETELLSIIADLNADPDIHAILVQLPLPAHIDPRRIISALDPRKDADGLHPLNAGKLVEGIVSVAPCTPHACILLARSVHPSLAGAEAVVLGRSNIVGRPLAQLLLVENATVTIAHSRTQNLADVCRRADLVFAAVGKPELVRGDWIKPGATVIDVGVNRLPGSAPGKSRIVGDVAFAEARDVAGAITPVPGGVGPMTIACLLLNALLAARSRVGLGPLRLDQWS